MSVKQRLTKYIKHRKISIREFCRSVGVSETYVSSMRNSIQPNKLDKISEIYPELNIGWLIFGEGEMIKPDDSLSAEQKDSIITEASDIFKDKLIEMFKNGEIYSESVVKDKEKTIRDLLVKISIIENENKELKQKINILKNH